ncbi:MAG: hypothetical protein IJI41_04060 [Anaerolineaceae bacterium]|nr:hypothetical protein [Anaerolineaceae bacterium]
MGNKVFRKYVIIWLIALIMFNVVCFVVPTEIDGMSRLTGSFWTSYVFITIALLGNLASAWFALKAETPKKLFYNMPLLTISYTGLILMLIIGSVFMIVPSLPQWLGIIICFLILAFTAIAVIQANTAAELVQNTDAKIRQQTSTMRELTAQAESLIYQAKSEDVRAECQKVYEMLRYADPMSNEALSIIEVKIKVKIDELSQSIFSNNVEKMKGIVNELLILVEERNVKSKKVE